MKRCEEERVAKRCFGGCSGVGLPEHRRVNAPGHGRRSDLVKREDEAERAAAFARIPAARCGLEQRPRGVVVMCGAAAAARSSGARATASAVVFRRDESEGDGRGIDERKEGEHR